MKTVIISFLSQRVNIPGFKKTRSCAVLSCPVFLTLWALKIHVKGKPQPKQTPSTTSNYRDKQTTKEWSVKDIKESSIITKGKVI